MLKSIVLKILAGLALLSGVYFLTVVGVLHLVRSDLNPISEPISFYRQNESSWYLTSGFLLVGAGEIVLAYLLPIVLPTVKLPGRFLLVLSGVGVMMLGIQREGTVHLLGALLQAILFPVALLLLADALADSFERRFSRFVSLTNMALFPLLMLAFAHSPLLYPILGFLQKLDVALMMMWSSFVLWKIYQKLGEPEYESLRHQNQAAREIHRVPTPRL